MTAAPPRRDNRQPSPPGPDEPPPKLGISFVQVLAAALAAATATVAASFLGVAGTVVGAALASVISVTGTALYSHSLRRTGRRVRQRVARPDSTVARPMRFPADRSPLQGPGGSSPFDRPTLSGGGFAEPTYYGRGRSGASRAGERAENARLGSVRRRLAVAALAVFIAVLAVLTGVELLAGHPISDLLRGRNSTGTTLFGTHHGSSAPAKTPAPQHTGPSGSGTAPPASHSAGASSTAAPTSSPSATVSATRGSSTTPAPASSTAVPSTSPAPSSSPVPSVTSGSPTPGSARTQSVQP